MATRKSSTPKPDPKDDGNYQKFLKGLKAFREAITPVVELARIVKSIFL